MIVIFEGHDHSGKSTIAKEFALRYNGIYIRDKYLKDAAIEHVNQSYARYQLALFLPAFDDKKLIVIDRAILSHIVYSSVFHQAVNADVAKETLNALPGKAINIICYKTGKLERDEMFDNQDKVRWWYLNNIPNNNPQFFKLNTTDQDINKQMKLIRTAVERYFKTKLIAAA